MPRHPTVFFCVFVQWGSAGMALLEAFLHDTALAMNGRLIFGVSIFLFLGGTPKSGLILMGSDFVSAHPTDRSKLQNVEIS